MQSIGDVNPIEYGGGYIIGTDVEYFEGLDSLGLDEDPEELVDLEIIMYQVNLYESATEFLDWYDWVNWNDVADTTDGNYSKTNLKTIRQRSRAIEDIASYYGWNELDQYPLRITLGELMDRWDIE